MHPVLRSGARGACSLSRSSEDGVGLTSSPCDVQYKTVAPVGERVLVKVDVGEEKSVGGILLPSSAQKKPTQGHVERAGTAKAVKVSFGLLVIVPSLLVS